jgi:arsenate reductase
MASVLFVCLQNAGRSQISQALFERAAGARHTALSAGTTPAERVHPEVIAEVRATRDQIARRVEALCEELEHRSSP